MDSNLNLAFKSLVKNCLYIEYIIYKASTLALQLFVLHYNRLDASMFSLVFENWIGCYAMGEILSIFFYCLFDYMVLNDQYPCDLTVFLKVCVM